jgi:hypothetical protein
LNRNPIYFIADVGVLFYFFSIFVVLFPVCTLRPLFWPTFNAQRRGETIGVVDHVDWKLWPRQNEAPENGICLFSNIPLVITSTSRAKITLRIGSAGKGKGIPGIIAISFRFMLLRDK